EAASSQGIQSGVLRSAKNTGSTTSIKSKKGRVWKSMIPIFAVLGRRGFPPRLQSPLLAGVAELGQFVGGDTPHTAEAAIVGRKTGIGIAGALPLAHGGAAHLRAGLPVSAAQHPFHILSRTGRPMWIGCRTCLIVLRVVDILAPHRDIAVHIAKSPAVRL